MRISDWSSDVCSSDLSRAANKRKVVNASLNVVAILVVAGAFAYGWLTGNRAPPAEEQPLTETAAAGGSQHVEPAKVQIFEEDRELGTMLVSDERAAEFVLRNVGGKPLHISEVRPSFMCTFRQVLTHVAAGPTHGRAWWRRKG